MRRWTVVLISPQESGNIGAAARVAKNFGAGGLRIVAPRCEVHCPESRRFSSGAADLLRRATIHPTLAEAIADQQLAIGLTGVGGRHHRMDCITLLPEPLLDGRDHLTRCALVYGPEDTGMTGEDMHQLGFLWSLPTNKSFPSLNLAQAVAVSLGAVAEVERQRGLGELGRGLMLSDQGLNPLSGSPHPVDEPATAEELALLMERARAYLEMIHWDSGTRMASTLSRLQNLLVRSGVTRRDINMLHGMARNAMHRMAGEKS